ncbi:MAG TPA: transcription antitermination factor NusB [Allocoleopsis sp.]
MQPRQIARELAVLSMSQMPANPEKLATQQLSTMILAVVRTLSEEAQESLEQASNELKQSNEYVLQNEINPQKQVNPKTNLSQAIELTKNAINRVGMSIKIPEFIYLSNQQEVKSYALEIIRITQKNRQEIDDLINSVLTDGNISRFGKIDRDILRVAVAEIRYLGLPEKVAINEAVEISKRYSVIEGYKLINGILRKVTDYLKSVNN